MEWWWKGSYIHDSILLAKGCCIWRPTAALLVLLGAYIHGWVLLWQPGQICSLPGDGRARAGLSFLSFLPGKEGCGFLCSRALCQPCSCSGHSAETLHCCDFCSTLPKSSLLRSWGLTWWGCKLCLASAVVALSLVISCDHQESVMSPQHTVYLAPLCWA